MLKKKGKKDTGLNIGVAKVFCSFSCNFLYK